MKKVLITGASGFIGGFLVEEALKRNFEVYAGVRSSSKKTYLTHPDIHFFDLNLSDKNALKAALKKLGKLDYVIHNAGATKVLRNKDFEKVNFQYTKNLIEALVETKTIQAKFIFMSSLATYGPGDEKSLHPIQHSDTPKPITLYGKSKLKAEQYITALPNFPYLIFRPTGVYGPREKDYYLMYKSIQQGIETYIGTPEQHITFIYVKDLTRLIFDALVSKITNKAYFATDLNHYTAKEFNTILKSILNKKTIRIIFPKPFIKTIAFINENIFRILGKTTTLTTEKYKEISCTNWLCDSREILKDFDFTPEYNLEKGLKETIAWYQKENLL